MPDRPARDLSDPELISEWCAQNPTDDGTSPRQEELADELERRDLDV
jgi:hypothetical protein